MYINIKSKYKKFFWLLLGFILSCIYVHKVSAAPSFQTYDFNDFSFSFNNVSFNKESLFNFIEQQLSLNNKSLNDYQYITISIPTSPQTSTGDVRHYFKVILQNVLPTNCSGSTGFSPWYCGYNSSDLPSQVFDIYYPFSGSYSSVIYSISQNSPVPYIFSGNSSSNTMKVYTNYDFSLISVSGINSSYTKFYYDPNMLSTEPPLPDYLTGYKKITLTTDDKYYMLSGLSSGSVYIPTQAFEDYGGRLSYYDNDLSSQPYTSYIQDYITMPDGEFVRQSFNLSNYSGADWVMFSKYIYLEGEDNITYDIYVPNDIYDSDVEITPNTSGGNNFDFDYKDENGDIQSGQIVSTDLSQVSPLLGNIFSDFSSNTFGLTSIITAPLGLISSLSSSSCISLSLPLPYVNTNLTLPCMTTVYQNTFGSFFTLYQTITFGIVAYWVIVKIFNIVKDAKNPEHDEIEVIDL